jgi:hypothetical protein
MARGSQKDLLSRLADAGEKAIQRLPDTPGADKLMGAMNGMRDRMDEMQKKLRGLDALERRVAALEKKAAKPASSGSGSKTKSSGSSSKTSSSKTSSSKSSSTKKSS